MAFIVFETPCDVCYPIRGENVESEEGTSEWLLGSILFRMGGRVACPVPSYEGLVCSPELFLCGVIPEPLSPTTLEEVPQAWRSELVQVDVLVRLHELVDRAHEGFEAGRCVRPASLEGLILLVLIEAYR